MTLRLNLGAWRQVALGLVLTSALVGSFAEAPATAGAATSIGPLTLTKGGSSLPAVQVPSSSLLSFSETINGHPTSKGYGGGKYGPGSATELTVTKLLDSTSTALLKATADGTHFQTAAISWQGNGKGYGLCLTDVFVSSYQSGGLGAGHEQPTERVSLAYGKLQERVGIGPPCGNSQPPVAATLLGIERHGSVLVSRVDCLSAGCRGILAVSLPSAACPPRGGPCSFTGGVRTGLAGGGKVHFNGDGTATLNGGTRLGLNGAGKFSMGDGSVKIVRLSVPPLLRKWVAGHQDGLTGAIIVVARGQHTAFVQRGVLNPPAKLPAGAPSETLDAPGLGSPGQPADQPQSLSVTSCSTPVVGVPGNPVTVTGTLSPPRGGAKVTLTYTPVSGAYLLPSTVVHSVTTDAAGSFNDQFARSVGGYDYSWSVVASIAEGDGYAAAQSAPCAIPIP